MVSLYSIHSIQENKIDNYIGLVITNTTTIPLISGPDLTVYMSNTVGVL